MILVEIKKSDKRLGVKKGEVYVAKAYWLDPQEKVNLVARVPDGFVPECNHYWHEVIRLGKFIPSIEWKERTEREQKQKAKAKVKSRRRKKQ